MPLVEKGSNFDENHSKPGKYGVKPRVLVAPLDWGLGHATRCIPLVRALLARGCEVLLAGEGAVARLLEEEFPGLTRLPLPGYRVRYTTSSGRGAGWFMALALLQQWPAIRWRIARERRWLRRMVRAHRIQAVIADNRYGLHHPDIPCIFLTHQLQIRGLRGHLGEGWLRRRNYGFIRRFTECWVPDFPGPDNLSGDLGHPAHLPPIPVRYSGPLSRLEPLPLPEKPHQLLVLLSGPEPQRSLLEDRLLPQLARYGGSATVLRGLPDSPTLIPSSGQIRFFNHLPAAELNRLMQEASLVISRSGYSTVMDLARLQKKSILLPTPGQTEQLYLAGYLHRRSLALQADAATFQLRDGLADAARFPYQPFPGSGPQAASLLDQCVESLLERLSN